MAVLLSAVIIMFASVSCLQERLVWWLLTYMWWIWVAQNSAGWNSLTMEGGFYERRLWHLSQLFFHSFGAIYNIDYEVYFNIDFSLLLSPEDTRNLIWHFPRDILFVCVHLCIRFMWAMTIGNSRKWAVPYSFICFTLPYMWRALTIINCLCWPPSEDVFTPVL